MDYLKDGAVIVAVVFFLFQIFRRLRSDYPEREIVRISFLGLIICFILGYFGSQWNLPVFWPILVGVLLTVWFSGWKYSWRFLTTMETIVSPGLISLLLAGFNKIETIGFLIALVSNLYWRSYRRFHWYPSGRGGFIFLVDLVIVSLFNVGLDFYHRRLVELTVWLLMAVVGALFLILISGRRKEHV